MPSWGSALPGVGLLCLLVLLARGQVPSTRTPPIRWQDCLAQKTEWYGGAEALRIADNVLRYQRASGGWPKNIEMAAVQSEKETVELERQRHELDATIDNGATSTEITYLARVLHATQQRRLKDGALRGIDYLLSAQYDNGGWPQCYPQPQGYQRHITFNDNAMINVMNVLDAVARRQETYLFVDEARRRASELAVRKGVECILACQVLVKGRPTGWCAQHSEQTFEPAPARTYEHVSLSGMETVGILRFLMRMEKPNARIVDSVTGAVVWLEWVQVTGIRVVQQSGTGVEGGRDRVVVQDPDAPPLWARFYEIGTNRPIFSGRDGIVKYSLAEIEAERRTGYQWYVNTPDKLLSQEYPSWRKRWVRAAKQGAK